MPSKTRTPDRAKPDAVKPARDKAAASPDVPSDDPLREKSINGGHQGSSGQRDKHDR